MKRKTASAQIELIIAFSLIRKSFSRNLKIVRDGNSRSDFGNRTNDFNSFDIVKFGCGMEFQQAFWFEHLESVKFEHPLFLPVVSNAAPPHRTVKKNAKR